MLGEHTTNTHWLIGSFSPLATHAAAHTPPHDQRVCVREQTEPGREQHTHSSSLSAHPQHKTQHPHTAPNSASLTSAASRMYASGETSSFCSPLRGKWGIERERECVWVGVISWKGEGRKNHKHTLPRAHTATHPPRCLQGDHEGVAGHAGSRAGGAGSHSGLGSHLPAHHA